MIRDESAALSSSCAMGRTTLVKVASVGLVSFASYLQISLAIASLHLKSLNIAKSER
jgi:hypothetical protein